MKQNKVGDSERRITKGWRNGKRKMKIRVVWLNGLEDSRIEPTYRKKSTMGCSIKNITLRKTSLQVRFLLLSQNTINRKLKLKYGWVICNPQRKLMRERVVRMQHRWLIGKTIKWKNEPSWTNGSCLENSRSLKTAWGFETLFFRKFGDSKLWGIAFAC